MTSLRKHIDRSRTSPAAPAANPDRSLAQRWVRCQVELARERGLSTFRISVLLAEVLLGADEPPAGPKAA